MRLPFRFRPNPSCAIFAGLLATFACSPAAHAQISIGVTIGTPPPPLRYEVRPVYPGAGYLWQAGYWEPFDNQYSWRPGFWAPRPYTDAYYVRPFYAHDPDGYRMHPGHWEHRGLATATAGSIRRAITTIAHTTTETMATRITTTTTGTKAKATTEARQGFRAITG